MQRTEAWIEENSINSLFHLNNPHLYLLQHPPAKVTSNQQPLSPLDILYYNAKVETSFPQSNLALSAQIIKIKMTAKARYTL